MIRVPMYLALFFATITVTSFISIAAPAAEEGTVEAFSSWKARGQIYPTGPAEATFVGVLSGVLYVKNINGSFDTGLMTCPAALTMNTTDSSQSGQGKCVIVTPDDDRIYAEFKCVGVIAEGCNGDFTLKGGTGGKESISGSGPIQFKSTFTNLTSSSGNIIQQSSIGLAVLPKLSYKLP